MNRMYLKKLQLQGFKSFAKKTELSFTSPITAIVGPNGSGKSNTAEAFRFVLGEQSMKSMRGKRGEDLIFSGTSETPRSGRASVKLTFDNSSRFLDVDFNEVQIERVVNRDGSNEYSINGSVVRLKDILELLTGAHVGSSGHHIISQGEADRILNSNSRERKAAIEDALGLRVFQYKKFESERKLEKTEVNMKEVASLRRENAPHLKFLQKQVEKIEKTREMRENLKELYKDYFKREELYVAHHRKDLEEQIKTPRDMLARFEREFTEVKQALASSEQKDEKSDELIALETEIQKVRVKKQQMIHEAGRIDGEIASQQRLIEREQERLHSEESRTVLLKDVQTMAISVENEIIAVLISDDVSVVRSALHRIRDIMQLFTKNDSSKHDDDRISEFQRDSERLQKEADDIRQKNELIGIEEKQLDKKYAVLKETIEGEKDNQREAEKNMFRIRAEENKVRADLQYLEDMLGRIVFEEEEFRQDIVEASTLVGTAALDYKKHEIAESDVLAEERSIQRNRKKEIEKMKVRIEDAGGGTGEEITKEFNEVKERDIFLGRELVDMEKSAETLRQLIVGLEEEIDRRFKEGIVKINAEFQRFFALMFGGGSASLKVIQEQKRHRRDTDLNMEEIISDKEEQETEDGIDINVSLPRKKIKGLEMLSGGERALTSIALLFAMSQVNPPPFIILDETDAALDEANSRKYGDMVEDLSKHSQLILITHNRETMSRAGVLYGVTMGFDGVSALLSIAFEEAISVAK